MRLLITLTAIAAATLPASAQLITIQPEQVGQIWCISNLGNDMASAQALLTPALAKTIADAEARNDAIAKQTPDEKPPLGDGIPWHSWTDYADGCTTGAVTADANHASVVINYTFKDYPDANYADTLLLEPVATTPGTDPVWRIANVEYADKTLLTAALVTAFEGY